MGVTVLPESSAEAQLRVTGGQQGYTSARPGMWQRPADWLSLGSIVSSDSKFVGLVAITNDDANYLALTAAGDYTVDWGDGTTENFASGVAAQHQYTYSAVSSGSASIRGYRQVLVTVTPQAGQSFTSIDLQTATPKGAYSPGWLDIAMAGPSLASIKIGAFTESNFRPRRLERIQILGSAVTTWANQFANVVSLREVSVASSGTVTSTANMFYNCSSLTSVAPFSTNSVTSMSGMFNLCVSLRTIPQLSTGSVTNFSNMFTDCWSLTDVPRFDTSAATTMNAMFSNCYSLQTAPSFNTANNMDFQSMFSQCRSLRSAPAFNTASATSTASMFAACRSLQFSPAFDLSSATSAASMFGSCESLQSVGPITLGATEVSSMFGGCYALTNIPTLDFSAVPNPPSNFVSTCYSLASLVTSGMRYALSVTSTALSRTGVETLMDSLGAAAGSQTFTYDSFAANPRVARSHDTTVGSKTVALSDTSNIATGMEVVGEAISTPVAVTFQDAGDTVARTAHGLLNDDKVAFASLDQTTGVSTYTPYYVVNKTADTFQVADTAGGSAKTVTVAPATTFSGLIVGSSSTDASFYIIASATLKAGRLYLLSVENSHGTSATAVSAVAIGNGNGVMPTFTSRGSTLYNSNLNRISVWSAAPQADYVGTITIDFGGVTQTGACWSLVEVKGINTATNHGIVQAPTATGSSTTPSVNLAALGSANNVTFGAQGHAAATSSTPGGSYVEIHDTTTSTPAQALQTLYLAPGSTTVSSTITSAAWGIVGMELKRADDGVGSITYSTTVTAITPNTSVTLSIPASGTKVSSTGYYSHLKRSKAMQKGWTVSPP